jgi:hypothetical protein
MNKQAFLRAYKEAAETLKDIKGYNPEKNKLDMKENLRSTYGKFLDKELGKASEYSKQQKLPFDMGKGYGTYLGAYEDTVKSPMVYLSPRDRMVMKTPRTLNPINKLLKKDFPGINIPKNPLQEYVRHEMAHAATMGPGAEGEGYKYTRNPRKIFERLAVPEKEYTPYYTGKTMSTHGTYPEKVGPETIPPLAAIQQHLFETTGKRIEDPKGYDAYVKQLEAMPLEKRQQLPVDIQRFIMYRDKMREAQQKPPLEGEPKFNEWMKNRLKDYDQYNRRIIPGVVKAQRPGRTTV